MCSCPYPLPSYQGKEKIRRRREKEGKEKGNWG
jgi:hypothetical protein